MLNWDANQKPISTSVTTHEQGAVVEKEFNGKNSGIHCLNSTPHPPEGELFINNLSKSVIAQHKHCELYIMPSARLLENQE